MVSSLFRKSMIALIVALLIASAAFQLRDDDEGFSAKDAEIAALSWVRVGEAEAPRREGDDWEVDVRRPDGSLVQVTIDEELQLRNFDEEFGPAGTPAPDELRGAARARAIEAAFWHVGPARVVGVERDPGGVVEVGLRMGQDQIEVRLDRRYKVIEVQGSGVPKTPRLAGTSENGEGRNRTGDTTIFSRVLYQLSYLAARADGSEAR